MIGLRCTVFYCDWYDYTLDRGVRIDAFGVRSVHSQRKLQYYDPIILASQADQVCYIRYPRVRQRDDPWITVTSINPRGRVEGVSEPLQPNSSSHLYPTEDLAAVELVVDLTRFGEDDVVHSESEAEIGEYGNDSDSCSSDPSSDSEEKRRRESFYIKMGISFPCPLFSLSLKPYVASLSIRRKAKGFLLPFHSSHPKSPLKSCLEHLHSLDVLYLEVLDGQPLPTNMDIDELIRQPGRETLPRLNPNYKTIPNTTWFGLSESGVSKSLLRIVYSGLLPKGWPTYAEIPPRYRDLWFRQFAQEYNWDSGLTGRVKISFDRYATRYYSGRIKTKAQSETNSKNKRSDRGGKGAYVHNLGSTSLLSRERELDSLIKDVCDLQLNNLVLEAVPKKKGRYVGIGRSINDGSSSSVHCPYPVQDLLEQIKNKDEEIALLKTENAEIRAELQVTKSLTETIMDKLKNRFGEDF
ncbi:BnaA03g59760D [Brassica napus]|uniref:BnaA03g59760D protein n=1 Tax=Brassica napus TaxID=3708 RepID=A0A078GI44_BRANA|nr:BnaA03g59760D [Brassica napus]